MKFFANVLPALGLTLALALGAAAVSLTQVLDSVELVTSTTKNFDAQIKRVSSSNIGHEGASVGKDLDDLTEIITGQIIGVLLSDEDEGQQLSDRDAASAVEAYQLTAQATADLIQTLMDDHALFQQYALVSDIIKNLRPYRAASVQFVGALKGIAESQSDALMDALSSLDDMFEDIIQLYEQS